MKQTLQAVIGLTTASVVIVLVALVLNAQPLAAKTACPFVSTGAVQLRPANSSFGEMPSPTQSLRAVSARPICSPRSIFPMTVR